MHHNLLMNVATSCCLTQFIQKKLSLFVNQVLFLLDLGTFCIFFFLLFILDFLFWGVVMELVFSPNKDFVINSSKKRFTPPHIVSILDVQQRMLGASFEGSIFNQYGCYNVVSNAYKYIHCGLTDSHGFLTIILIIDITFVTSFSPCLKIVTREGKQILGSWYVTNLRGEIGFLS